VPVDVTGHRCLVIFNLAGDELGQQTRQRHLRPHRREPQRVVGPGRHLDVQRLRSTGPHASMVEHEQRLRQVSFVKHLYTTVVPAHHLMSVISTDSMRSRATLRVVSWSCICDGVCRLT
jgi:hypothetical protein